MEWTAEDDPINLKRYWKKNRQGDKKKKHQNSTPKTPPFWRSLFPFFLTVALVDCYCTAAASECGCDINSQKRMQNVQVPVLLVFSTSFITLPLPQKRWCITQPEALFTAIVGAEWVDGRGRQLALLMPFWQMQRHHHHHHWFMAQPL